MAHVAEQLPYGTPMSVEDWVDLAEEIEGELVDGQLVEEEMNDARHELVVAMLIADLSGWLRTQAGLVLASNAKFRLDDRHGRKADLSAYFPGRKPAPRGLVRNPPDIAVEVVSPRPRDVRRDRVEKMREYAAYGVRFYWLVDPEIRSMEVLELGDDGRYRHALGATEGVVEPPGCPGLRVDLDALWAAVDDLEAQ
jgi:Uma2 family endonuclease